MGCAGSMGKRSVSPAATRPADAAVAAVPCTTIPARHEFLIVADLDGDSLTHTADGKPLWRSYLRRGYLLHDAASGKFSLEMPTVNIEVTSTLNAKGRGMELSDLCLWNGSLFTCDDKTGEIYELTGFRSSAMGAVPRFQVKEGSGAGRAMKTEWLTVKAGKLVVGSNGVESFDATGAVTAYPNSWAAVIGPDGSVAPTNMVAAFDAVRAHVGMQFPGYINHETGLWSDTLQQWVFLPRRMSKDPYNYAADEHRGANTLFLVSADYTTVVAKTVGTLTPERGYSAARFVPGTGDRVLLAVKSIELAAAHVQTSFLSVITIDGQELLPETEIPGNIKFEGLEFI